MDNSSNISGVYMILNLENGKCYIGSSKNIGKRQRIHRARLNNNTHLNPHLKNSWNKYGKENFKFVILEETENKLEREQYYIDLYDPEYNILRNVKATPLQMESGCREDTIENIRETCKEKGLSKEMKQKLRKSNEGKERSEKTKQKISESEKGRELSEETKQKISETLEGRRLSEETRRKMSKAQKEREYSDERNRKISEAQRGEKSPTSKLTEKEVLKIRKLTNYISGIRIAELFKVSSSTVSAVKNRRTWAYLKKGERNGEIPG